MRLELQDPDIISACLLAFWSLCDLFKIEISSSSLDLFVSLDKSLRNQKYLARARYRIHGKKCFLFVSLTYFKGTWTFKGSPFVKSSWYVSCPPCDAGNMSYRCPIVSWSTISFLEDEFIASIMGSRTIVRYWDSIIDLYVSSFRRDDLPDGCFFRSWFQCIFWLWSYNSDTLRIVDLQKKCQALL